MAIRQVVVSDIGGKELAEGESAKVSVSGHPVLDGKEVELDISVEEADKLQDSDLYIVNLIVRQPGKALRAVTMEVDAFEKLFPAKSDPGQILANARVSDDGPPRTRRRRSSSTNGAASSPKLDYTSPEHAGQLHRGRVTEAEAEWVRNNLEAANANRAKAGQDPIDPSSEADKRRYGF